MSDYESPYPNPKHRNPEKKKLKAPTSVHHEAKYVEEKLRIMEEMFLNHGISRATESDRKDFIRTIVKEIDDKFWAREQYHLDTIKELKKQVGERKPKVSMEWVYYFCAYINAGHKSPADDKARVNHAIKKLKEIGMEVEG